MDYIVFVAEIIKINVIIFSRRAAFITIYSLTAWRQSSKTSVLEILRRPLMNYVLS